MTSDLISADELAHALTDASGAPPVLLDIRWRLGAGAERDGYLAGHISGAVFIDLDAELAGPPGLGGRHPLPEPDALQAVWRRAGISDGDRVVAYDDADGTGAVRAWWLLRWSGLTDVRVLDGGLGSWTGAREQGEVTPTPGTMTVRPGGMPTADLGPDGRVVASPDGTANGTPTGESVGNAAAGVLLLDARAAARYRGEFEPLDPVAGHIPGAVNLPYTELYTADGRLRPPAELGSAFAAVGAVVPPGGDALLGGEAPPGGDRPPRSAAHSNPATVVASCGSGVSACHLILAGRVVGLDLALHPGSYSQWCALGRPVVGPR